MMPCCTADYRRRRLLSRYTIVPWLMCLSCEFWNGIFSGQPGAWDLAFSQHADTGRDS